MADDTARAYADHPVCRSVRTGAECSAADTGSGNTGSVHIGCGHLPSGDSVCLFGGVDVGLQCAPDGSGGKWGSGAGTGLCHDDHGKY